jgi:SAM-dependent methyltransferase
MPSLQKNLRTWDETYAWSRGGDDWSDRWGGTENLWSQILFPRISQFIPAYTILEIAPGFGRCTDYLKNYCHRLVVVDLSPRCVEACKKRFSTVSHITYHVNDGKSLAMIPDGSIDFVFSFDSLVHAEADVLESYIKQLAKMLKPNGTGFIHHSNLGSYPRLFNAFSRAVEKALPFALGQLLRRFNVVVGIAGRSRMTADLFARFCADAGLSCLNQELISWTNGQFLIDSFSTFTNQNVPGRETTRTKNPTFARQLAGRVRRG